tara:strand:- start:98 stop:427 length:330 start_codon:yes stop_codon:yes gene_type:complete
MIACGEEGEEDGSSDSDKSNKDSAGWSSSEIKEKVNECVEEGGVKSSVEFCTCMVEKISERMTYSEFSLARKILDATDDPSDPSVSDSDRKMILRSFRMASKAVNMCGG